MQLSGLHRIIFRAISSTKNHAVCKISIINIGYCVFRDFYSNYVICTNFGISHEKHNMFNWNFANSMIISTKYCPKSFRPIVTVVTVINTFNWSPTVEWDDSKWYHNCKNASVRKQNILTGIAVKKGSEEEPLPVLRASFATYEDDFTERKILWI